MPYHRINDLASQLLRFRLNINKIANERVYVRTGNK